MKLTRPLTRLDKLPVLHLCTLGVILLVGGLLRFWQLDAKPLWLDEIITAVFTLGRSYQNIPLEQFFSLEQLNQVFTYQPGSTCAEIAHRVATESVHPPLFFCLLYQWVGWLQAENWLWALRALPALIGVGCIAAMYWLNRVAFSPSAGLASAALMAVSPFAVYLSQEARHYTLPMLLITLALAGLVQMQQDLANPSGKLRPWIWLGWTGVNAVGLYVHYFCLNALIAQITGLGLWLIWQKQKFSRHLSWHQWGAIGLSLGGIFLSYLPWLPTLISHFDRPETDWLKPYRPDWQDRVAPLYQTLVNWTLMVIALPVEQQPDRVVVPMVLLMLGFALWLAWRGAIGFRRLWREVAQRSAVLLLSGFTLCMVLQFFAIVYVLDKDITVVPRYNFVYYPGVCALLGASLVVGATQQAVQPIVPRLPKSLIPVVLAGLLSSVLVTQNLVFQKSYSPDRVAQDMAVDGAKPLAVVVGYNSLQEVALGLSFAFELQQLYPQPDAPVRYAFLDRSNGYGQVWQTIGQIDQSLPMPLNLWVVASPGMRTKDYPKRLRLVDPDAPNRRAICSVDPEEFDRIGFPYQLFRCEPWSKPSE